MQYVDSGFLVLFLSSIWLLLWTASCYGIGSSIVRFSFQWDDLSHPLLFFIFSVSAGLFFLSLYVFLAGSLGMLKFYSLLPYFSVGILWFAANRYVNGIRRSYGPKGIGIGMLRHPEAPNVPYIEGSRSRSSFYEKTILVLIFILIIFSFVAANAPETGNDALNYHLYFPKLYVEHSKIFFEPTHPRSLWPFMMEMLFTAGLLCQGAALAKLFHLLTTMLAIFSVPAAAIYFWKDKKIAVMSLLFMAAIPAIWMQGFYAYVDNAMMLYTFLSFVALWIWKERGMPIRGALIPAIFLSALISIKFYSLVPCALLLFLFVVSNAGLLKRSSREPKARGIPEGDSSRFALGMTALFLLLFLFSGFWFFRSWYYWGNPVFPFMANIFGEGFSPRAVGFSEMPKTLLHFFLLPWNLSMKVKTFGGEPLGVLFLISMPLIFIFYKRLKGILLWIGIFCLLYLTLWFFLIQHMRFLFPLFPFLSLLFWVLLSSWYAQSKGRIKKITSIGIGVICVTQFFISLYYPAKLFKAGMGIVSADEYLASSERSYAFLREVKSLVRPTDTILFISEPRLFYSPVKAVFYGPAIDLTLKKKNLSFNEWLKRERITHLLTKDLNAGRLDPNLHLRFGHTLSFPYSQVVKKEIKIDDEIIHYALWKIDES
ncbi:MAG: hypothetical protein AAB309_02485 [Deltaproteobacteria bacterium]